MPKVPERISWAVDRLELRGSETVLEIGSGRGVAAALVCDRLTTGRLVAIDRSDVAVAATAAHADNRVHIANSSLTVIASPLAELTGFDAAFDLAFAINVNLFWLDAAREMPVLRRVLRPDGRLALFYEPPTPQRGPELEQRAAAILAASGWKVDASARDTSGKLFYVSARPR